MTRLDDFAAWLEAGGASGRALGDDTIATYVRVCRLLERRGTPEKVLRPSLSAATKMKYVAGMRQWARFTEDGELAAKLAHGPKLARLLRARDSALPVHVEAFDDAEVERFLDVLDRVRGYDPLWVWPAVSLQVHLGLRVRADLAGLKRVAVEAALDTGRLSIMGKRGRIDQMPARFVADALAELLDAGRDVDWTTVADLISPETADRDDHEHGKSAYRIYRRVLVELGREAGIDAGRTHRFRHWAITRFYREVARGDIVRTKRFARHESLETTLRYIRSVSLDEDDRRLAELRRD